jgi:hypothetical protein
MVPAIDMAIKMPSDGAIIFADLIGKLEEARRQYERPMRCEVSAIAEGVITLRVSASL